MQFAWERLIKSDRRPYEQNENSRDCGCFDADNEFVAQTFTMLHTFMGNDGANPEASLMFNGDTLYGTTSYGGQVSEHDGTVFKINPDGSSYKMLKAFDHYDSGNYDGEYAGLEFSV